MADSARSHDRRSSRHPGDRPHHWRRDLVELAALFVAVTVADSIAKTVVHGPDGPVLLMVSAVTLLVTAVGHTWWAGNTRWARRPGRRTAPTGEVTVLPAVATGPASGSTLWRMRTTVREEPGALATLCTALAERRIDILALQSHPLGESSVDEFLLGVASELEPAELIAAVSAAGGQDTWLGRADAHELVDAPTRALDLAARTALQVAELPLALRQLLGRCTVSWFPQPTVSATASGGLTPPDGPTSQNSPVGEDGVLEETRMLLRSPEGGTLVTERAQPPFTPTEFARAHALVELATRIHAVTPDRPRALRPAGEGEVTVRTAGPRDVPAAREMHRRCSTTTLELRYHGPATDADRYLAHLLMPRFGRSLAVETDDGQLVALGHLLWDGDETEVTVLVEDAWQRRGLGTTLLRQLVALAVEAGCTAVYAVTRAPNTGLVTAMRQLGLPLDFQLEETTLVVTAQLGAVPTAAPAGGPQGRATGTTPS